MNERRLWAAAAYLTPPGILCGVIPLRHTSCVTERRVTHRGLTLQEPPDMPWPTADRRRFASGS